jgi:hypothetical protein
LNDQGCSPVDSLVSPQNKTYTVDYVSLIIVDQASSYRLQECTYFYILDGVGDLRVDDARVDIAPAKVTPELVDPGQPWEPYYRYALEFNVSLSSLANGSHSLIVGVAEDDPYYWENPYISSLKPNVYFTVDALPEPPAVCILSPYDGTYEGSVPLSFTVSGPFLSLAYSLNYTGLVGLEGNSTLRNLREGSYSLRVFATDMNGRQGVSETVTFTFSQPKQPESFPTTLVAVAVIVSAAVVSFGLVAYFLRRKKRRRAA